MKIWSLLYSKLTLCLVAHDSRQPAIDANHLHTNIGPATKQPFTPASMGEFASFLNSPETVDWVRTSEIGASVTTRDPTADGVSGDVGCVHP